MSEKRIRPYEPNPFYWQYKGKPVLLLGGSVEDNLFQIEGLREHLDLLASSGGNYVRCVMSSRDEGNVWAFERDRATGLYDLQRPSGEYWGRFERFLALCEERNVIVQIEVWATFDFYKAYWLENPFNPKNNINYTAEESGLPEQVESHPIRCGNPFFFSIPAVNNNRVLLPFQKAFVERLLSYSLRCGNVLYCMDNETSVTPEWGAYWARLVRAEAERAGVEVHVTEMWDKHDLNHEQHANTFDNPDLYSFVDVSQNNHQQGQTHWDRFQQARRRILDSGRVRPMNNVKIYGANTGRFGTGRDGRERFWRNIFAGAASARFHRPPSGLGLSPAAQANIRSARMLTDAMDVFRCEPALALLPYEVGASDRLGQSGRSADEAYCMANVGKECGLYFPDGGVIPLDVSKMHGDLEIRWLDIERSEWRELLPLERAEGFARVETPEEAGYWAAVVKPRG